MELITLEDCKRYVKYEVSEDDLNDPDIKKDIENLDQFRNTAIKYLKNATGKDFISIPVAKTFCLIFVDEMFSDFKGLTKNDVTSTKNLLLAQLRYDNEL